MRGVASGRCGSSGSMGAWHEGSCLWAVRAIGVNGCGPHFRNQGLHGVRHASLFSLHGADFSSGALGRGNTAPEPGHLSRLPLLFQSNRIRLTPYNYGCVVILPHANNVHVLCTYQTMLPWHLLLSGLQDENESSFNMLCVPYYGMFGVSTESSNGGHRINHFHLHCDHHHYDHRGLCRQT